MAELKLGVSFDLVYFRQQLDKLGRIAASEFTAPIKISVDRKVVDRELENLQRLFARREYRIKINDSTVEAASLRIDTLQGKVNALRKNLEKVIKIKVKYEEEGGIGPTGATQASGAKTAARRPAFLDSPAYQAELKRVARANAQTLAKAAASLPSGRNRQEAERLLQAFQAQNPQGASRSAALSAIRELIARGRYQQGLGFEARMQPLRGQRGISAPRSMPNLNQMLDRIANLTENPRAAQRMLRMMPEGRLTTDLIGAANRQAAFREQFPGGFRMPGFQGRKAFDPLLKAIAKDFSDYARTVNTSDPWVGKIGDGIRRIIATSAQPRQAGARAALPAIGMTGGRLSTLERQLAQSRGTLGTGGAASGLLFSGGGAVNPGVSMPSPVGIAGQYRQMAAALANQAANPALAHRQIADIGFGAVPTSATGLSGQALNAALNQAYLQRRGLGVSGAQSLPIFNTPGVAVQQNIPGMAYQMARPKSAFAAWSQQMTAQYGGVGGSAVGGAGGGMGGGAGGGSRGGFGGFGGGGFGRMMGFGPAAPIDFSFFQQSRFPLTGAIRELGEEFGTAVKQVLLFGTAYKAFAFITDLPNQVLAAATALQTFRNQLEAVTGGSAQAEQAFAFVGDVAAQLNVPLESARAGFVRMFASMEPAGIAKLDIENLFLGISKAAATFGMSTDEVNRMTNAFAQMASKGQLSAEEVKNQLGDVMPGALSLFARAAQMDIGTFLKAMEDGQFKAEAMGQVLRNVGKLMNTEFSGAAAGAANTLQGSLNGLSNAVKLMYESFEPLVALVGAAVFPQLEAVITDATEAVKAFVAGMQGAANPTAELSSNGEAIYNAFGQVAEIGKSLEGILTGELGTALVRVGGLFLSVTEYIARFLNTGLGQWLTRIALQIGLLTTAWGLLARSGIIPATAAMVRFVATLNFAQLRVYIAGIMSMVAAFRSLITMANLATVAVIGLKTAILTAVGVGVLFAIDALVQRFTNVGNAIRDVAAEARRSKADLDSLAAAGQLAEVQGRKQLLETELQSIERAAQILEKIKERPTRISGEDYETLKRTGTASGISYIFGVAKPVMPRLLGGQGQIQANLEAAQRRRVQLLNQLGDADEAEEEASRQAVMANERNQRLEKVTLEPKKEKAKKQSMKDLIGGDIARWLDESLSALETDIQEQITSAIRGVDPTGKITYTGDPEDAERMIKYAGEYRRISLEVLAIDETIKRVQQSIPALIANGIDHTEKLADLETKRKQLFWEAATVFQKHSAGAEKAAKKRAEELKKEEERRRRIAELIEDAAIAAGEIGPLEAARRLQRKGMAQDLAQAQEDGTPEQVAELMRLQARIPEAGSVAESIKSLREELEKLASTQEMVKSSANSIGEAFSTSFKNAITGASTAQQAFASFFQSVADSFADMAAQMISKWMQMQLLGLAQQFLPGLASFAGGAQLSQQVNMPVGVGIGAGNGILQNAGGQGFGTLGPNFGIRQFATGGMVTGPTLGLIGEGRFNEAVVPMPNGKSIPVDLGGAAGSNISTNIVVNMNNGQASSQMTGNGGQALGRELEGAVRSVLLKESRPGGIIYSQR